MYIPFLENDSMLCKTSDNILTDTTKIVSSHSYNFNR